jgi:hypothetical protein
LDLLIFHYFSGPDLYSKVCQKKPF